VPCLIESAPRAYFVQPQTLSDVHASTYFSTRVSNRSRQFLLCHGLSTILHSDVNKAEGNFEGGAVSWLCFMYSASSDYLVRAEAVMVIRPIEK